MLALRRTCDHMRNWAMLRGLQGAKYQGPQSFVHKSDVARLNFSVSRLLAPAPLRQPSDSTPPSKPYTAVVARPLLCLKCDECGKLRRVDQESFLLFSPLVWEEDALRSAEAELLGSATTVRDFLHACEATDTVLDVPAVNPALASCLKLHATLCLLNEVV